VLFLVVDLILIKSVGKWRSKHRILTLKHRETYEIRKHTNLLQYLNKLLVVYMLFWTPIETLHYTARFVVRFYGIVKNPTFWIQIRVGKIHWRFSLFLSASLLDASAASMAENCGGWIGNELGRGRIIYQKMAAMLGTLCTIPSRNCNQYLRSQ
jgi:hypothetical protein